MISRVTLLLALAVLGRTSALICPDGGMCEEENTCCQNPSGGYGCCPLPKAECCEDHLHCCYEGTLCDLVHSKCVNKTVSLSMQTRTPARRPALTKVIVSVGAVICPDKESECPDQTTCCELPDGSWGCCPMAQAVCCADKTHCCPQGTTCDTAHSKCVSPSQGAFPMWAKFPARRRDAWEDRSVDEMTVPCPDGKSSCPDGTTCCQLVSGSYGCCPLPEAVCCTDHLHCCPKGSTCDLEHDTCNSADARTPLRKKLPSIPNDVICPDKVSTCPDDTTCCIQTDGTFGCCPMPRAVCCSDHLHCCPEGTTCDLTHNTCVSANVTTAWATKVPATVTTTPEIQANNVPCNDSVACADGTTCCKNVQGEWSCCPLPEATCCDDHLHCCPHGTVCNLAASTCDSPSGAAAPWLDKVPALTRSPGNLQRIKASAKNMCDQQTSCPRDTTCCFMKTMGKWGCCPLPEAVCCRDGDHCCPRGYKCDPKRTSCIKGRRAIPWYKKEEALTSEVTAEDVKCDAQTSCASGTTCCKLPTGQWGCCPLVKAVCCADQEHCCPQGYSCNMQSGTCEKQGSGPAFGLPLTAVLEVGSRRGAVEVACGGHYSCSDSETCCKTSDGTWACCPTPNAVCCEDRKHCCPAGYTCDSEAVACTKAGSLSWDTFFSNGKKKDFIPM